MMRYRLSPIGFTALRILAHVIPAAVLAIAGWHIWLNFRPPVANAGTLQAPDARSSIPPRPVIDGEQVATRHLFGAVPVAASAAPVTATSPVHVIGILSGGEQQAWAILDINGNQQTYNAGAALPDGETLVAVGKDRVTLEQRGNRYSVMLDIHPADMNAHFDTLNLGAQGPVAFESKPFVPPPSPDDTLQVLRAQLLKNIDTPAATTNKGTSKMPTPPPPLKTPPGPADHKPGVMIQ